MKKCDEILAYSSSGTSCTPISTFWIIKVEWMRIRTAKKFIWTYKDLYLNVTDYIQDLWREKYIHKDAHTLCEVTAQVRIIGILWMNIFRENTLFGKIDKVILKQWTIVLFELTMFYYSSPFYSSEYNFYNLFYSIHQRQLQKGR